MQGKQFEKHGSEDGGMMFWECMFSGCCRPRQSTLDPLSKHQGHIHSPVCTDPAAHSQTQMTRSLQAPVETMNNRAHHATFDSTTTATRKTLTNPCGRPHSWKNVEDVNFWVTCRCSPLPLSCIGSNGQVESSP